ncbi:MAG: bifunctional demethylmenaquinone methyltransferase/2-methoxy-6-polyprenyl-1,4-benzoquinol methylase UbiE [candidate division Zixibacteria bacterium]|nr:bifunctional demethylmenaquinone methyltransferase/2-methoxy-6-polyprenyl-1,4-benzoquinol methylase UbiE [candidate division Zixibacteria bacterium]
MKTMNDKPLKEWSQQERIQVVKGIFSTITPHYDRMNRILSARRDVSWRRFMIRRIPANALEVLDVATGTGDVVIDIAKLRPDIKVTGIDFVKEMLDLAVEKTKNKTPEAKIDYVLGDAMELPFEDNRFDVATIAFGMRNIPGKLGALLEMARVVKPGGKLMVLEMTFPRNIRLRRFFHWYLNNTLPVLGKVIARNRDAYNYLSESIQDFLHPDELTSLFEEAGLKDTKEYPLTLGITYLHEGIISS